MSSKQTKVASKLKVIKNEDRRLDLSKDRAIAYLPDRAINSTRPCVHSRLSRGGGFVGREGIHPHVVPRETMVKKDQQFTRMPRLVCLVLFVCLLVCLFACSVENTLPTNRIHSQRIVDLSSLPSFLLELPAWLSIHSHTHTHSFKTYTSLLSQCFHFLLCLKPLQFHEGHTHVTPYQEESIGVRWRLFTFLFSFFFTFLFFFFFSKLPFLFPHFTKEQRHQR
jgi:hypothetical protein